MASVTSAITYDEFAARLSRVSSGQFLKSIRQEASLLSRRAQTDARSNAEPPRLRVRTGRLRNSIFSQLTTSRDGLTIKLSAGGAVGGKPVRYARIQERGGTITPKNGKWLAAPFGPALTAAGVPRFTSARAYGDQLRFQQFRGNLAGLIHRDSGEIYYFLFKSVTIKPKWYMRDAFEEMLDRATLRLRSVGAAALEV